MNRFHPLTALPVVTRLALLLMAAFGVALGQAPQIQSIVPVGGVRQIGPDVEFRVTYDQPVTNVGPNFVLGAFPSQVGPPFSVISILDEAVDLSSPAKRGIAPGAFNVGDAWTLEFMMRSDISGAAGPSRTVVSYAVPGSTNELLVNIGGEVWVKGGVRLNGPNALSGTWTHVAITSERVSALSSTVELYINGVSVDSGTYSGSITPVGTLVIGEDQDAVGGDFDPSQAFLGDLDELRIWNFVRSATEIADDMQTAVDLATPGLVHLWAFDEVEDFGVGTPGTNDVDDLVGGARMSLENLTGLVTNTQFTRVHRVLVDASQVVNGTRLQGDIIGGPVNEAGVPQGTSPNFIGVDAVILPQAATLVPEPQGQPSSGTTGERILAFSEMVEGLESSDLAVTAQTLPGTTVSVLGSEFGNAVDIAGAGGPSILFNNDFDLPPGNFTIECWCRPAYEESTVFSFASNTPNACVMLADGRFFMNDVRYFDAIDVGQLDGRWHHFRISVSGIFIDRYIDGVKVGERVGFTMTSDRNGFLALGQEQDAFGGSFDPDQALDGPFDELRIWSTFTPTVPWNEQAETNTPGLWAYYRCEAFDGPAVRDLVGNQDLLASFASITAGPDRARRWRVELGFADERTNYAEVEIAGTIEDDFGRTVTNPSGAPALSHVQVEDLVMSVEVNGTLPEFHQTSAVVGDHLVFRLNAPGGSFVGTGVPLILAQFPTTGTTPGSVFGFPELRIDLGLPITTVFDGTAGGFIGPATLPSVGHYVFAVHPGGLGGTSLVVQGLVLDGNNAVNNIFAVANVLVVDL